MIQLTTKSFVIQKEAESREDCQDACGENIDLARFAVADGATRSFFPKEWAELLVEHFCEESIPYPTEDSWRSWMRPIQEKWYAQVAQRVAARDVFYLNNRFNLMEPAASTFIGLEFNKMQATWRAMIVGDTCLFHVGACGFNSYVIERATDFTSHPGVFASYDRDNHFEPTFVNCHATPGDTIILATDALAQWILRHEQAGRRDEALNVLQQIENQEQFDEFINRTRTDDAFRLVNDDVTLMMIAVKEDLSQAGYQAPIECSIAEPPRRQQAEASLNLFWIIAAVVALPALFYVCWLLFFSRKDA